MNLYINGEKQAIDRIQTLQDLLGKLGINPKTVLVEHNESVVAREKLSMTHLSDNDKIEIVHFVGGGAPEETPVPSEEAVPPKAKKARKKPAPKSESAHKSGSQGARNLVIVESPSKAKTINKFLGSDYLVEASMGHVRDLPRSKMGVDIEHNFEPHYIVVRKSSKVVKHLKKQAKNKETIYLAPDPDREGEAISWHLEHLFREKYPEVKVKRVVFNEITKDAIKEAFKHPREIAIDLVNAQQARRILDRIVGYELSPLLWRKVGRGLSAGRVQSVALRLIADREKEIKNFVPVEYWTLEAVLHPDRPGSEEEKFRARLDKIGNEKPVISTREQSEQLRREIEPLPFKVEQVEQKERTRKPQAPFTTSKLQQEAYNRLKFSAAKTMRAAQQLYEGVDLGEQGTVGLITYMRTDSVNIAVSAQKEAADYIQGKYGKNFLPDSPPVYKSKKGAQEAHEAIRPTSVLRDPESLRSFLEDDAFKLYELVWKKFVASQMNPAIDQHLSVSITAGDKYFFKTTGRKNVFPGFLAVYDEAKTDSDKGEDKAEAQDFSLDDLPVLEKGDPLKLTDLPGDQHFTKPPSRYNDASLVKVLEEEGIGRPSTYAPTIYTLISRDYVSRKGGAFVLTELGEIVINLLVEHFPKVIDVPFTAGMEEELDKVEEGSMDWIKVLKDFYGPFKTDVDQAKEQMKNFRREVTPTDYTCDLCGKQLLMKWGRFGKFLACSGWPECKFTRSLPTGFFCPEKDCGGELVKRMSKNRRIFYGCSKYPKCNYITNKLPKQNEEGEEESVSDKDRELGAP